MHWTDTAIVLSFRKHGENSAVARIFAREHGVYAGVVRGIQSKTNRGIVQPGNIVLATWQARLSEHLGNFKTELLEAHAAHLMQDAKKLAALTAVCSILETSLPERHPYPRLYALLHAFLLTLQSSDDWPEAYVRLELDLLAESGFGLDLSCCAATGGTENLIYVSPKSGRAVSAEAGEPYKDKLLPLPAFLLPPPPALPPRGEGAEATSPAVSLLPPPPVGGRAGEGVSHRKPNLYGSHALIDKARELRRQMTPEEQHLWYELRAHRFNGYRFRRQHPLSEHYIVDFICLDKKLVIELDGGQHADQQACDEARTRFIEQEGYRLLRFWNNEVFENLESVLTKIMETLTPSPRGGEVAKRSEAGGGESGGRLTPSPALPPTGGGGKKGLEILAGMQLTSYFLDHWLLAPHNRKLPAARGRLMEIMKESYAAEETAA